MLRVLVTWCLWKSLSTFSQIMIGMDATQVNRQVVGHNQPVPAAADGLAFREWAGLMQTVATDLLKSSTVHIPPGAADELQYCVGAGFPCLGLSWQKMENPHMRASMGMKVSLAPRGAGLPSTSIQIRQEEACPYWHSAFQGSAALLALSA